MMRIAARCVLDVLDVARNPKWIGGTPGILAVLHTWSRTLAFHPHVHLLVTAGGLQGAGEAWSWPCNRRFAIPGRILSELYRKRFLRELARLDLLGECPRPKKKERWVVHVQRVGDGRKALRYLARYVYRVALANASILMADERRVVFRYRDSRTRTLKTMTLEPVAFLRRFLQHVLPEGFVKVRYGGLFASACREHLAAARQLLERELPPDNDAKSIEKPKLPRGPRRCAVCGRGHLPLRRSISRDTRWDCTAPPPIRGRSPPPGRAPP